MRERRSDLGNQEYSVRNQLNGRSLAILGYHKIGEPPPGGWQTWFYVPEEIFVGHLSYLREHGWRIIDLLTLFGGITAPESLPERAALLTFDDGYRSMRTVALPWLLRFGYPAVLFVPTDYIGGSMVLTSDASQKNLSVIGMICGSWNVQVSRSSLMELRTARFRS